MLYGKDEFGRDLVHRRGRPFLARSYFPALLPAFDACLQTALYKILSTVTIEDDDGEPINLTRIVAWLAEIFGGAISVTWSGSGGAYLVEGSNTDLNE
jgi:hypothetical protein